MPKWSVHQTQFSGPGFEPHSGHMLDLFSVLPRSNPRPSLKRSQLAISCQLGFLTLLCPFEFVCFITPKKPHNGQR